LEERINFYHTPIDREVLKSLTKRSDIQGLLQSLGMLIMYSATTALALYFYLARQWIPMVIACYIHSMLMCFLGMEATVHELSHGTPFRSKKLSEFFYYLFSFLSWNNPVHFRESHLRHHQLTVFKGRDKEVILDPAPFGLSDYISWFIFDYKKFIQIMGANLAFVLGKDSPDVFSWDPLFQKDNPLRAKMIRFARIQLALHLILIALFIYFKLYVLIFTVSLSYFAVTFLAHSVGMVQHIGLKPNIADWRMTCHTMRFGPVMAFLYWRMNYHIEHHMYASVPFYNLHKLHAAIAADTPEPVRGHFRGVRRILGFIEKQRREPDWTHTPKLPASAAPAKLS